MYCRNSRYERDLVNTLLDISDDYIHIQPLQLTQETRNHKQYIMKANPYRQQQDFNQKKLSNSSIKVKAQQQKQLNQSCDNCTQTLDVMEYKQQVLTYDSVKLIELAKNNNFLKFRNQQQQYSLSPLNQQFKQIKAMNIYRRRKQSNKQKAQQQFQQDQSSIQLTGNELKLQIDKKLVQLTNTKDLLKLSKARGQNIQKDCISRSKAIKIFGANILRNTTASYLGDNKFNQ